MNIRSTLILNMKAVLIVVAVFMLAVMDPMIKFKFQNQIEPPLSLYLKINQILNLNLKKFNVSVNANCAVHCSTTKCKFAFCDSLGKCSCSLC
uniref:Uncharacterized protein n=1 Tax=Romanomermis culicivorax TaxID=13658 RepID=A0A915I4C8_ROMCU